MTGPLALFAPGKLFVVGEWAILEGAPALVACVPAGQEGLLCLTDTGPHPSFSFNSEGYSPRQWTWRAGQWIAPPSDRHEGAIDVVGEVVRAAPKHLPPPRFSASLDVKPRGLFEGGQKLGFGSSGAIAALTARALAELGGGAGSDAVFRAAFEGHREAQQGRGSGADVAVSVCGQSVRVQLPEPPGLGPWPSGHEGPRVSPLSSLTGLSIVAVWSGQEANTRQFMTQMARFKADDPQTYKLKMAAVARAAHDGDNAWRGGDLTAFLSAASASHTALGALGDAAKIPIVVETYGELAQAVRDVAPEAVTKLSGAGGGDMALALAPSAKAGGRIVGHLRGLGYRCFEVM